MSKNAATADGAGAGAAMDEAEDEYCDPNLCSAFGSAFLYYTTTYIPKERTLASSALAAALGSASGLHTPNGKGVGQMAERRAQPVTVQIRPSF